TEMKLAQIWEDVLGIERVGVQDNFFELGGHSLKAVSLVSKMHQALEVDIRVRDIFEGPTIRELGAKVQGGLAKKFTGLVPLQKQDSYPVSSAQKRLYAIQSINPEDTSYNLPMVLTINGNVDQNQVVQALHALVNKHEVLRTSFHMEEEDIVQRVHDAVELEIAYTETSAKEEVDEALGRWIQPFDLSQAPLIRSGIVREGEQLHLLLDMHHIISDGSTMALLAEDFVQAFDGTALEAAAIQYKEYAEWEREQHRRGMWEQQKQYWKQEYAGEIPVLEMPLDGVRGKAGDNEGERIQFEIREETVQALKEASSAVGGTLYMGLMAGFSILLSKYSGQEDLVIGSPIAGRRHAQLEKIAGMFVNTLAIRTQPEGDKKVQDYLREVRDK
ncbi:condensation domain-containing protein, partial [Paenibacillus sp. EKM211P]